MAKITIKGKLKSSLGGVIFIISCKGLQHTLASFPIVLNFFTAGSTFFILKKLHNPTTRIITADHECLVTVLTFFLYKGWHTTRRTVNIKCPTTTRANRLPFFHRSQAAGAQIPERAAALTAGAVSRIPIDVCTAVYARMLISRHVMPPVLYRIHHRTLFQVLR